MTPEQQQKWLMCAESPLYFMDSYLQLYDATSRAWLPFKLWPAQADVVRVLKTQRLIVMLKARQIGMSWLCVGYALWLMLFHPAATVSLFSRREEEAAYLLGTERLRGMYQRLPEWMHVRDITRENNTIWELSNGSVARAFPTTAGDAYTVTLAIVDEADLSPDLGKLMTAAKPTIDGGGQMILLSRPDKSQPNSEFKAIYRGAKAGENGWAHVFLPWDVRPERDAAWYEAQKRDILSRTGALDDLAEQYPTTDIEALAPKSLDKRIPFAWLEQCYIDTDMLPNEVGLPGLVIYARPIHGRAYVIGADPAEGNPTSDDSAATVLDAQTGEEVARLRGKFQPSTFASYLAQLSAWYLGAGVLPERNNHGHAVILWLTDHTTVPILAGHDGKPGWLSNSRGKALMYTSAADALRDQQATIHSFDTFTQLASIEGSSLLAPSGELDDLADSFALGAVAMQVQDLSGGVWAPSPYRNYRGAVGR